MGTSNSAALKRATILLIIMLLLFAPAVLALILVAAVEVFSIVPFPMPKAAVLVITAALATFSIVPRYVVIAAMLALAVDCVFHRFYVADKSKTKFVDKQYAPVSVNYFPSRHCNYACRFCFQTNTSGYILPMDEAKRGLRLLKKAGMRKLNITGGEPFLHPKYLGEPFLQPQFLGEPFLHPDFLGELLRYCKEDLRLESVGITSDGSKICEGWLRWCGRYLDVLAVSCDSFVVQEPDRAIGRRDNGRGEGRHVAQVFRIARWCREFGITFELNTVVNTQNWGEDMSAQIAELAPSRWRGFQCLIVEGENEDENRVRDARKFAISQWQWEVFCEKHRHLPCYVPEDNQTMAGGYLQLDERMRFLDKGDGLMKKSDSLLEVGVEKAMQQVAWDKGAFDKRGGIYEWRKPRVAGFKLWWF